MNRKLKIIIISLVICVVTLSNVRTAAYAGDEGNRVDAVLRDYGMPEEQIHSMDADIKQFIVNDLSGNQTEEPWQYVEIDTVQNVVPRSTEVLTGITFTASAFKSNNMIHVFPTYEFTSPKFPQGEDSFAVFVGEALIPYEYGGQLWYSYTNSSQDWDMADKMVATSNFLRGAEFAGSQLGDYGNLLGVYVKGCAYIHAIVGDGSSKQCVMNYMHNPNKGSYSASLSYGGMGLDYSATTTIYKAAGTVLLDY